MIFRKLIQRFWAIAGAVSIRTKILGIVLGMVALFGVGVTVQARYALTQTMTAQLEEQSVSVSRDLAARATDPICSTTCWDFTICLMIRSPIMLMCVTLLLLTHKGDHRAHL